MVGQDQVDHVGKIESTIDGQLADDSGDKLLVGDGIAEAAFGHCSCQDPEELVIPLNPGQVALCLLRPVVWIRICVPGWLILQMAGPDHLERLPPIEVAATGRGDVKVRVCIEYRLGKVHVDPTERIDDVAETVEVQFDIVLNGDSEVLLDGCDELARSLLESSIDLVGALNPSIGDEQVTGDRKDGHAGDVRIEVEDHDHIAVHTIDSL